MAKASQVGERPVLKTGGCMPARPRQSPFEDINFQFFACRPGHPDTTGVSYHDAVAPTSPTAEVDRTRISRRRREKLILFRESHVTNGTLQVKIRLRPKCQRTTHDPGQLASLALPGAGFFGAPSFFVVTWPRWEPSKSSSWERQRCDHGRVLLVECWWP